MKAVPGEHISFSSDFGTHRETKDGKNGYFSNKILYCARSQLILRIKHDLVLIKFVMNVAFKSYSSIIVKLLSEILSTDILRNGVMYMSSTDDNAQHIFK